MLFSLMAFSFLLLSTSCGGDDPKPCSTAFGVELQAEINAFNSAAQTYSSNPTVANCIAYKAAAQAYVDALEPYGNCSTLTGQARTDWEASLAASKASVAAIQC
ncbi:MAG: hypothetical protein M3Q56_06595 [Bacteroidota bacterium]|nr:hypothetical protein [Bacteroidota bacterium]